MGWFGPSKDEVWQQLSEEIGAEFIEGGCWKVSRVQAYVGPWTVTLDPSTESSDENGLNYTLMRAPFVNAETSVSRSTGRDFSAIWASSWGCRTSR
jgi:hypothetical protein